MTRSKAFSFEVPTQAPSEEQEGEGQQEGFELEVNGEKIRCVDSVSGLRLLEYVSNMGRGMPVPVRARAMTEWLQDTMVDYEAFRKIAERDKIDIDGISDICAYLEEVYSTRPTEPPSSSSSGQETSGSSSEEGSS